MFHFDNIIRSTPHIDDGDLPKPRSTDDNLTSPTSANLVALHKTQMTVDFRTQVGAENMYTFPGAGAGISSSGLRLNADRIVDPYVNHLKDKGQLVDQRAVDILRNMVTRLGKPALAQQLGNPQQYVSHGFDHSERVAGYIDKISKAYPEIEESAAKKYNISRDLARFSFKILAHWHDIGYPDLDHRPKATHGLSGASKFDESMRDQLGSLIRRENGRTDQMLLDMRKAIQLHSADVDVERYAVNVKTDRGSLLVPDAASLEKLLNHYSASTSRPYQVSEIEIRGSTAKEMEKQVNDILKTRSSTRAAKVTAHEDKPEYTGRPTSLDKDRQVNVGLRYTEQELTKNPFAVIRFADNLDMASDRLSPLQRSPAFRAMYWKLGDQGAIGQTLSELGKLDPKNKSEVPDILRNLRSAAGGSISTDVDSSILSDVAERFSSNAIHDPDALTARRLLIRATVDSVLSSPVGQGLSETDRASLRKIGYCLNEESIRHFGGCEAIESVEIKAGKVIVTVNGPLYRELNEVKDPAGIGIGEYQIERARQAFSSLTINGKCPVLELAGQ
jgi:hypothetical protein